MALDLFFWVLEPWLKAYIFGGLSHGSRQIYFQKMLKLPGDIEFTEADFILGLGYKLGN